MKMKKRATNKIEVKCINSTKNLTEGEYGLPYLEIWWVETKGCGEVISLLSLYSKQRALALLPWLCVTCVSAATSS